MSASQPEVAENEEEEEYEWTGFYRLLGTVSVKHGISLSDSTVATLHAGTSVEALEVVYSEEEDQIRARIKEPAGWISIANGDQTENWATKEVDRFDIEAAATCAEVHGHLHSIPARSAFKISSETQYGNIAVPDGLDMRIVSSCGMKSGSGQSPNQDAYSYTHIIGDWIVCVVCDGHGLYGEVVAQRVATMIPLLLSQLLPGGHYPADALSIAFTETQNHLENNLYEEQYIAGATVATCLLKVDAKECWFAHCGDSTLMLGDLATGSVVRRTKDHFAHDPNELQRLKAAGARVLIREYDDEKRVSRVFIPGTEVPGLAMSRAIGDGCLKEYGVTAEPDIENISRLVASCQAPAIVMASDGLWNFVSAEEVLDGLMMRRREGRDVLAGVDSLCRVAQETMANQNLGEEDFAYCDDTTVALIAPSDSLRG